MSRQGTFRGRMVPVALLATLVVGWLPSSAQAQAPAPTATAASPESKVEGAQQSALASARRAVARVSCKGRVGAGFVAWDRKHLITYLPVVSSGRTVRASFEDGTQIDGTVVGRDERLRVAIVLLERDAPSEPLVLGTGRLGMNDELQSITPTAEWESEPVWTVQKGRVVGESEELVRVDGTLPMDSLGAPLVDGAGQVVGVAVGEATPTPVARASQLRRTPDEPYHGGLRWGGAIGYQMHLIPDKALAQGVHLAFTQIAWDRLVLTERIGYESSEMIPKSAQDVVDRRYVAAVMDADVGYRFLLSGPEVPPLQLVLAGGVTAQMQSYYDVVVRNDGTATHTSRVDDERQVFRPTLRVGTLIGLDPAGGDLDISYCAELEPGALSESSHRFLFSLSF